MLTQGSDLYNLGPDRRVAKKGPSCIWTKWVASKYKGGNPVRDKRAISMGMFPHDALIVLYGVAV